MLSGKCYHDGYYSCCCRDCIQSVTGSATPDDASKGEISDIKAELRKLLDDAANDDMGYAGQYIDTRHMRCLRDCAWVDNAMPCIRFGSPADMMKAVNSALNANYSGKAWLKWFTTTAKAVIAELDASSATDGVRECVRVLSAS